MTKDDLKKMYEYIKIPEVEDQFAFRISEGKFKVVVYKYNKFGVNPDPNPDDTLTYKFEYDILEIPEEIVNKKYADEEGKEFETLIGDILIEILQEKIEILTFFCIFFLTLKPIKPYFQAPGTFF